MGFLGIRGMNMGWRDFAILIRLPNLLIIVLTQYFTAIFLIGAQQPVLRYLMDVRLFLLSLATVCIASAGYIINDYYDIKIDYLNRPRRVVVGKRMRRRTAMVMHWSLNVLGVLIGLVVSFKLGFINLVAAFLLWFYSNHLKRLPFLGNVTVALLTSLSILILLILYPNREKLVLIYAVFAFFINLIREIIKDMEDWKGDKAFGCRTLPIVWGIRYTKYFIYFLMIVFILLLSWMTIELDNDFIKIYFALLSLPGAFFVQKLIRSDTTEDFYYLSGFSKMIMLSGIFSMLFFKFF
jgi:4-hydroxybenzoate polyprenyltransferase